MWNKEKTHSKPDSNLQATRIPARRHTQWSNLERPAKGDILQYYYKLFQFAMKISTGGHTQKAHQWLYM